MKLFDREGAKCHFCELYLQLEVCHEKNSLIGMATHDESFETLREMVVGPLHTAYRRSLQTTLCGWKGN